MKYALILATVDGSNPPVPVEASPTVLAVQTVAEPGPQALAIDGALGALGSVPGLPGRTEDMVVRAKLVPVNGSPSVGNALIVETGVFVVATP